MSYIPLILIIAPVVYFCWQSYKEYVQAHSLVRFFQYGDDLKHNAFFATFVSSNSGLSPAIYLITVYGYFYGLAAFPWVLSFWLLTQFASRWTISRVEAITKDQGGFIAKHGTLHEFLGQAYQSQTVRSLAALLSLLCYIGLITCEVILGYEIISALIPDENKFLNTRLGVTPFLLTMGIFLIIVIYTAYSGFRAVIRTDRLQLSLLLIMLTVSCFFLVMNYGGIAEQYSLYYQTNFPLNVFDPIGDGVGSFMFFFVFMNVIFWAVWWPSAMDQWHRCAASKNVDIALDNKTGTTGWLSIIYFAFLTFVFLAVGAMIRTIIVPEGGEGAPIFYFLSFLQTGLHHSFVWVGIGLIAAGLVAAIVSTIDSYLVVTGQSLVSDVAIAQQKGKTLLQASNDPALNSHYLTTARKIILFLFIPLSFMVFFVSFSKDIFTIIYTSFSFMMAIIPALFIALRGYSHPSNAKAVQYSLVIGGLWAFLANLYLINRIDYYGGIQDWDTLTFFYNLLYANPPFTAVFALIVYYLVSKNKTS